VDGSTELASFDYDYARRRLTKSAGGSSLNYVYDHDRVVNEFSANGTLVNRYDYGEELLRGELGGEGERFYFSDALGSVTSLGVNGQSGASAATKYEYDAWGGFLSTQASTNRIGFTGQYRDAETGLMALGNGERYYSSALGRFIQQDSWSGIAHAPQSLNRYSYAINSPLKYLDPTGYGPEQYKDTETWHQLVDLSDEQPGSAKWLAGWIGLGLYTFGDTLLAGALTRVRTGWTRSIVTDR
jgi:RHS repeat-associated protein